MTRVLFPLLLAASGCAHLAAPTRHPDATAAAAGNRRLSEVYRREAVAAAFVMSDVDLDHARRPTCVIDVTARRDLIPRFLNAENKTRPRAFKIAPCGAERVAEFAAAVALANDGHGCAFDFELARFVANADPRGSRSPDDRVRPLPGGGVICSGARLVAGFALVTAE